MESALLSWKPSKINAPPGVEFHGEQEWYTKGIPLSVLVDPAPYQHPPCVVIALEKGVVGNVALVDPIQPGTVSGVEIVPPPLQLLGTVTGVETPLLLGTVTGVETPLLLGTVTGVETPLLLGTVAGIGASSVTTPVPPPPPTTPTTTELGTVAGGSIVQPESLNPIGVVSSVVFTITTPVPPPPPTTPTTTELGTVAGMSIQPVTFFAPGTNAGGVVIATITTNPPPPNPGNLPGGIIVVPP